MGKYHGKPTEPIKPVNGPDRFVIVPSWARQFRGVQGRVVGESSKRIKAAVEVRYAHGQTITRYVIFNKEGKPI